MEKNTDPTENILWHQTGVTPQGEPFIQLILNERLLTQLTVEQARDHATAMLQAAEAAEQDAFLMDFAQNQVGVTFQQAGQMLIGWREYRAQRTGKSQGPTNARDWVMPQDDQKMKDYPGFPRTDKPINPTQK